MYQENLIDSGEKGNCCFMLRMLFLFLKVRVIGCQLGYLGFSECPFKLPNFCTEIFHFSLQCFKLCREV